MHRAFSLAAQYIALAYALQPGKDVYAKSIQARGLQCFPESSNPLRLGLQSLLTLPVRVMHTPDFARMHYSRRVVGRA